MDDPSPGLDDSARAAFAWARYRRLLAWMAVASAVITAGAVALLDHYFGPLGWITILAAVGGFFGTAMMTAALMGLAFLSSGTGHDATVGERDD